jgi:hypothetical protein
MIIDNIIIIKLKNNISLSQPEIEHIIKKLKSNRC